MRILISGGGTGGHIFPALSIADAIKRRDPNAEILFVGAQDRMEMERVPAAGYEIVGLPVSGFDRKSFGATLECLSDFGRAYALPERSYASSNPTSQSVSAGTPPAPP